MKNLLITTVAFSVLLLIGCQENSITDPVQDTGLQKADDPLIQQGTITLDGLLVDPGSPFNNYLSISGQIEYLHVYEFLDPAPPAPQFDIHLSLSIDAALTSMDSPNTIDMLVAGQSEDIIYVSEEGIYLLEKYFNIQGRDDGTVLMCRFLVTTDGVGLNEMLLVLSDDISNPASVLKNSDGPTITFPPIEIDVQE